jgi:NADH-quinone oxidoreductase subunit F
MRIANVAQLADYRAQLVRTQDPNRLRITICGGTGCLAYGAERVIDAAREAIRRDSRVMVRVAGCPGFCEQGPVVVIQPAGIFYARVQPEDMREIVEETITRGRVIERLLYTDPATANKITQERDIPFYSKQMRLLLNPNGLLDPTSIDEYITLGGYGSLAKASTLTPDQIIGEITRAGLRGRGGAGFPTGVKWKAAWDEIQKAAVGGHSSAVGFVICNADEGDPGAFMDRALVEGNPHRLIEGMIIGAHAIGATRGYVYIRAEYPLAVKNLGIALEQARALGFLGDNILDSRFNFDIEIRIGAGAFVCGEETALIASIEGRTGDPRPRPPYPVQRGLWGKPTVINNVKTWSSVPIIIDKGAEWYASIGTDKSKGTMIFSLVGKVANTGLVEVPMGITLRELIYGIGGGIRNRKKFKAAQIGGPSGGCIPAEYLDTPVDYESLTSLGAIMGSGGLVVVDEETCMVDLARYFMNFVQEESCGKCTPCRIGTKAMLDTLTRLTQGRGEEGDIEYLAELAEAVKTSSLCGLGQTAPNPVLSTLKYFRHEYEAHIYEKRCPSASCQMLVRANCVSACPAGVDSPAYLALVTQGRYAEALAIHRDTNPFAMICGRVCPAFCEKRCRRGQIDEPIAIRQVKRFMADQLYCEPWTPPKLAPDKNIKVAIVGAGPCGLTAALRLAQRGYQVAVFERMPQPGGMMTYGIPAYRLPREPLFAEIENIRRAGVEIRCNVELGTDFTIKSLKADGYQAIVLALGAHRSRDLGVLGEDKKGVYHAVQMLRDIALGNAPDMTDKRVIIVGGGDTAMDAARSAWRLGAQRVDVVYRRTREDMPAIPEEVEGAIEEGIPFHFLVTPVLVLGDQHVTGVRLQRQRLDDYDNSGRRRPVPIPGTEFDMPCNLLVPAIGQITWVDDESLGMIRKPSFDVGRAFEIHVPGVFAAGDAVLGPASVVDAVAHGNQVALAVDAWLMTGKLGGVAYHPIRHDVPQCFNVDDYVAARRAVPKILSPEARLKQPGFAEVELGFDEALAQAEARRCLRCDLEWLEHTGKQVDK